ncbi:hypothetical protein S4A8_17389, partial [Salinisphaera sp. S4-8]|uniref:hypothetical protein n=1 Tax=Salinisphaera sp. S4-8 TaxID=633357 RepID=UPI003342180D
KHPMTRPWLLKMLDRPDGIYAAVFSPYSRVFVDCFFKALAMRSVWLRHAKFVLHIHFAGCVLCWITLR